MTRDLQWLETLTNENKALSVTVTGLRKNFQFFRIKEEENCSSVFASPVTIPGADLTGRSTDKTSDVINIFSTLKSTTNEALPQLQLIADNNNATHFEVATLVNQVVVALNTAHASALNLGITSDDIVDTSAISDALADVIDGVTTTLSNVESALPGVLAGVTSSADLALSGLMSGLSDALSAVVTDLLDLVSSLPLIGDLLSGGLLSGLGLSSVLGLLGGL
ncbi:hypothetical protein PNOK_0713200 [Pyrrhoderma noxium]|uniref:Uncharacterized protein n=1 Tax=Pyrrhoderma noxium TaxID=2282107 RepID=A0A286UBX5_9AGAM|nr:hypothetical protein PNOK_0713200 [Pyrrhoderma noxium]